MSSVLFDFVALFVIVAGLLLFELLTGTLPLLLLYVTVILLVVGYPKPGCLVPVHGGIKKPLEQIAAWL